MVVANAALAPSAEKSAPAQVVRVRVVPQLKSDSDTPSMDATLK